MRPVVPMLALLATTAAAAAGIALRHARDPAGARAVEAGIGRCTSDGACTFEAEDGTVSAARSTVQPR